MIATVPEQYCSSCNKLIEDADRDAGCCRRCGTTSRCTEDRLRHLTMRQVEAFYRLDDQDIASTRRSWIPVFPEGTFQHPEYGQLVFDETTIPQFMRNFRLKVRHIQPCVDVDHGNERAAGWIAELEWRHGIGLFALVDWTGYGLELLKDRGYKYTSAQFGDYEDEETGMVTENVLSAVTLTNFPFLKRLPAMQLSGKERVMTLPGFVVNKQKGMRRADDDEQSMRRARRADDQDAEMDDSEDTQMCRKCGAALDDSEELDDDEGAALQCRKCGTLNRLDDEEQLSDDELDDDQVELEGYDEDDLYKGPMSRFPRQPNRSDGQPTTGTLPSRRHDGVDRSAPGYSPGRDPQDRAHGYIQMGASERWLRERGIRGISPDQVIGIDVVRRASQIADERFLSAADPHEAIDISQAAVRAPRSRDHLRVVEQQHGEPVIGRKLVSLAERYMARSGVDLLTAMDVVERQLSAAR